MRFDVFGQRVLVTGSGDGWSAFYEGPDGKRRPATDIVIPPDLSEPEIETYLADLCHEWASAHHPAVKRLDWKIKRRQLHVF